MPVDTRFTIRAFREGDEAQILALFARAFPHANRGREHFQWEYQRSPFGNERISLTFDEAQQLVAQYAGYPVPLIDDGTELAANQIGDIMTDRSVRHIGRGPTSILARTANHFYDTFCRGKVAFNYGFTTAAHREISVRFLGSDAVEPAPYRVRDLTANPFPRIGRRERWPRGWQLELVRDFGSEYDDLFARVARAYRFLVRRDVRYLRWRYLECPDVPYFVVAIRKWRRLLAGACSVCAIGDWPGATRCSILGFQTPSKFSFATSCRPIQSIASTAGFPRGRNGLMTCFARWASSRGPTRRISR